MLAINLYYLNLLGSFTLRPRDVILGGWAVGSSTSVAVAALPLERF
jgi:hypothetical protein